jgi:hypothetical protein
MDRQYHLYVLMELEPKSIRYIGKTVQGLQTRFRRHIKDAEEKNDDGTWTDTTHRANWIRKALSEGKQLKIKSIGEYSDLIQVNEAEKFFIKHFRAARADLTNITNGGDGGIASRKPMVSDDVVIREYLSGMGSATIAAKYKTCKKRVLKVLREAGAMRHGYWWSPHEQAQKFPEAR